MPADPLVVILTLAARPKYARRAIDGLRACDGVGDAIIVPCVDPVPGQIDAIWALVEGIDFAECRPWFNPARLGAHANIRRAWRRGFELADYVAICEEDIVYARDGLDFHRWARDRYRDDAAVFSATAYHQRPGPCPPDRHHAVGRRPWFHPWGAGMWRDRWESLPPIADDCADPGWDIHCRLGGIAARGRVEVHPELSRCQNIGMETSVQDPRHRPPSWYAERHHVKHWAGNHRVAPGAWRESVALDEIPGAVTPAECRRLADLAAGRAVLEIGSQAGRSTIAMAATARVVHAIDWHRGDPHAGFKDTLATFLANLDRHGVRDQVIPHVGRAQEVGPVLRDGAFDFAFVDGWHDEAETHRYIDLVSRVVAPGGLVAFHDYFDRDTFRVKAAVDARFPGGPDEVVESLAIVRLPG
ncbi:O-methyltransferase [Tundrisphaera sp. TA3]|uniref:O-methyltransferase n=1 Tax=Tundrisphaera sp. TA3 TaxID=3435775 RepID=UPI003EC0034E